MKKLPKYLGPLDRVIADRKNSVCFSADLHNLDWGDWFTDGGKNGTNIYLHVRQWRADEGETRHRVYPKHIKGRICRRIASWHGVLNWLYDKPTHLTLGEKGGIVEPQNKTKNETDRKR